MQQSLKLYVDGHVDMYEQGVRMMDDLIRALESGTADREELAGNDTTTTSV